MAETHRKLVVELFSDKTKSNPKAINHSDRFDVNITIPYEELTTNRVYAELDKFLLNRKFIDYLVEEWGKELPYYFIVLINGKTVPLHLTGIDRATMTPIDWVYVSSQEEITPEVIAAEANSTKKWILMSKYGLDKFENEMEKIAEDQMGVLFRHQVTPDFVQHYVKVVDGTAHAFLKGFPGCTKDGKKYYYVPCGGEYKTPLEAIAASWNEDPEEFKAGWDFEA